MACKTFLKTAMAIKSLTEVKDLIRLTHPSVNAILDIVDEVHNSSSTRRGRTHLVLEPMLGGDLFSYHEKHGKLSEIELKWIRFQLVEGLKYIHGEKVAHRRQLQPSTFS